MARIVECRCGLEFYDGKENRTACNRCQSDASEKHELIDRLTKQYNHEKSKGVFRLSWAVIQCRWRHGLTIAEMVDVLQVDERTLEFEIDIARQNTR